MSDNQNNVEEVFLKDYKRPNFWIQSVDLEFDIFDDKTIVISTMKISKNPEFPSENELVLNGVDLKLLKLEIDDILLSEFDYKYENELLKVIVDKESFTLCSTVEIHPETNESCEGLYRSGNIFCTQNEAEGFRKITFYQDRPDVMAIFRTKIIADKSKYPQLLSNGNKVESGGLAGGRHFCTWEDPHKKPCYLYALVAGDLALVEDKFTTMSGREVALEIYVDHGNEDKCDHAMKSLINSMKWDEDKFGLEYDLDIYMIVAVDSFNMGAMENKGLNIFNSAYVLAKKETATDDDFQGVEAVIGHEYFHNWTGNRVTCRDWFQLTLKEGLTVFRDQEFSSDMLSRSVKRIDDVKILRTHQFPEDAGPMSHPIKPKSYIEMNNFYTSTVYDKGSEVIRMYATLLGPDGFRKGMDLYFKRHDGEAVTTEDFAAAMSDANNYDLSQFKAWYDQSGTPLLNIKTTYNSDSNVYTIEIEQDVKMNDSEYTALHIPFHFALYATDGSQFDVESDGRFNLKEKKTTIHISNITSAPIPSWNVNFSAPVIVNYEYSMDELIILMSCDLDDFNKYDACQKIYFNTITKLREMNKAGEVLSLDPRFVNAYRAILMNDELDWAFKAYALELPSLSVYNNKLEKFDLENTDTCLSFLEKELARSLREELMETVEGLIPVGEFSTTPTEMGKRSLKGRCLKLLSSLNDANIDDVVLGHFKNADNMTDEIYALSILINSNAKCKGSVLEAFYDKWKDETLVMQKWIGIQATSSTVNLSDLEKIEKTDIYDKKVPNILRSLVGGFATNMKALNNIDGSGYKFLADRIIEADSFNPQIASRLTTKLNHMAKLDGTRKELLRGELERIFETKDLSKDTYEIVSKNLGK